MTPLDSRMSVLASTFKTRRKTCSEGPMRDGGRGDFTTHHFLPVPASRLSYHLVLSVWYLSNTTAGYVTGGMS